MRAVTYARKSNDPDPTNRSLDLQRSTTDALCQASGYAIVERLSEVVSAYDRSVRRPQYERLLTLVEAEQVDVIVAVALDRLGRRTLETAKLLEACRTHRVSIHTARDGLLDPQDPTRGFIFTIYGAVAEQEAATTSARIRADKRARAEEGGWVGGTTPYGYKSVREGKYARLVLDPNEGEILKFMLEAVMSEHLTAGETARALNEAGKVTRKGKPWTTSAVQRALAQPALAGWSAYQPGASRHRSHWEREPYRDATGQPVNVAEPLLTPDDYAELHRRIARKSRYSRAQEAKWTPLLRGLIQCSCGRPMYPSAHTVTRTKSTSVYTKYTCRGAAEKSCTNSITGEIDAVTLRYLSVILKDGAMQEAYRRAEARRRALERRADSTLVQRLNAAQERARALEEALESASARDIPTLAQHLARARDEAEASMRELEALTGEARTPSPEEIMHALYAGTPEAQRAATQAVLHRVVIYPGAKLSLKGKPRTTSTVDLGRVEWTRKDGATYRPEPGTGVEALEG